MTVDVDKLGATTECLSCGDKPGEGRDLLYCGLACKETAKAVRYARARRADGTDKDREIADAIQIKIMNAVAGGFGDTRQHLPEDQRQAILQRDKFICQSCGKPGNEVDHISWAAPEPNDPSNLQVLCSDCHREKTLGNTRPATPAEIAIWMQIEERIDSPAPLRPADEADWNDHWRQVAKLRRAAAHSNS